MTNRSKRIGSPVSLWWLAACLPGCLLCAALLLWWLL
jgi:hypothetical protein